MEKTVLERIYNKIVKDQINFSKTGKSRRTGNYLTGRLELLEDDMTQAKQHHQKVLTSIDDEDSISYEQVESMYEKISEAYVVYHGDLLDATDQLKESLKKDPQTAVGNLVTSSKVEIKLPKINLPTFSGTYDTWRPFHDLFVSLIHKNGSLSEIQKFHYLKSSVTGEAQKLLSHLSIDNGNYIKAWTILTDRYDHARFLVNTQLKCLFNNAPIVQEKAELIKHLLDTSTEVLHSLRNLNVPVDEWDVVIIFVLLQKLPNKTQQLWEERLGAREKPKELPTFLEFSQFLEMRFRTLEAVSSQQAKSSKESPNHTFHKSSFHSQTNDTKFSCQICSRGQHSIRKCTRFLKMSVTDRRQNVDKLGICSNCLAYNHKSEQCPSNYRCYYCQQPHHSLLHPATSSQTTTKPYIQPHRPSSSFSQTQRKSPSKNFAPVQASQPQRQTYLASTINPDAPVFEPQSEHQLNTGINSLHASSQIASHVLLATAIVEVKSSSGETYTLRALLDSGSEATFITESAVQILRLQPKRTHVVVSGLGMVSSGTCKKAVDIVVASQHPTYEISVQAFVFKSLSGHLPSRRLLVSDWKHLDNLHLADPEFYKPSQIDLLLGSDILAEILLPELVRPYDKTLPIAQKTRFGWIVFGKAPLEPGPVQSFLQTRNINDQLQKFWVVEESPYKSVEPPENIECEEHYLRNVKRLADTHYQVALPFKGKVQSNVL